MRITNKQPTLMTRRQLLRARPLSVRPMTATIINQTKAVMPYVDDAGVTPQAYFYQPVGHDVPVVNVEHWRLRLSGLVAQPIALAIEDVRAMQFVDLPATIVNMKSRPDQFLMGHAVWRGVPFKALLEQANVSVEAAYAAFRSNNGYTTYLPLETLKGAVLATEMNGEKLSISQGYPVRLIVPGVYDYKMPKWLTNIEFVAGQPAGYFESRGWSVTGEVQTSAMIFSPRVREQIEGVVTFSGMAFAGSRDITQVELSVDDGAWMPVPFVAAEQGSWTRWQIDWMPPAAGDYVVKVRATDTAQSLSAWSVIHGVVFRIVL